MTADPKTQYIVYCNRFNEVKAYAVILISENNGFILVQDVEALKYKTFKVEKIISQHSNLPEANECALVQQKNFKKTIRVETKTGASPNLNREGKFEVCFTGFRKTEKLDMIKVAEKANFLVRSTVTKNLGLLVCGQNCGPSKLRKAHKLVVATVWGIEGFKDFTETGEFVE